jgi:SAM-dependent MidA family methyltransferase
MASFRDFMETALYDPETGFYARRRPREDFYTAPELHRAFADCLALEISRRLDALAERHPGEPLHVVEMGSGDGTLAKDVLSALRRRRPDAPWSLRFVLVERVLGNLLSSLASLGGPSGRLLGFTRISEMPRVKGVFYSNELVDALPFHLVEKQGGRLFEAFVESGEGGLRSLRAGPLSSPELEAEARRISPRLAEGGRAAVCLEARSWMRSAASRLAAGAIITVDYGGAGGEPLLGPRAYRRHRAGGEILEGPGSRDLTADVDFSALMDEGTRHGLKTVCFCPLGKFLIERGILERMPEGASAGAYGERNRLKTLFHAGGMGSAFRVLIQEKRP